MIYDLSLKPIRSFFEVVEFAWETINACSLYSLELRQKMKYFKLVFLDTGKIISKLSNVSRITTETALK